MKNASNGSPLTLAEVQRIYKERKAKFSRAAEGLSTREKRVANLRGLTFAGLVIGAGYFFLQDSRAGGLAAVFCALCFAWLVQYHGKLLAQEAHQRRFSIVNDHSLKRTTGEWHTLPRVGTNFAPSPHPYADDLDLFGVGSLYQRVSVAHTRYGQRTLAAWISEPASLEEIQGRQAAVLELSPQLQFRQELEAEGMALVEKRRGTTMTISDGPNPSRLLKWVKDPSKISGSTLVVLLSWLVPMASMGGIYAHSLHGAPPFYWLVPLLSGLALLAFTKNATAETFEAVSTTEGAFLRYGAILSALEKYEPSSPWLKERHSRLLGESQLRPSAVMRRFRTLVSWFDLRHNGMAYPFINGILLWDIHCTRALENWKQDSGKDLDRWFEIIGEFEAISSLAGLHADEENSTLAEVVDAKADGSAAFSACGLGHPLLPARSRVENDVEAFSLGQALLVTGSNMSGKSTFLRSLGVNAVLAFAGGPVIARQLTLPLCRLATSIRISDSLKSGVSHFYAEVQKLAHVVKLTEDKNTPVLFLLDEVLHGTNSRERQIGARWVLAELLKRGAFGVITTHDMELCRLSGDLMTQVRQHHFREDVAGDEMSFDYTLREGPVTSGNALRLMQRVGLKVPLDEPS